MQKNLNDIIPPSRRRVMTEGGTGDLPSNAGLAQEAPLRSPNPPGVPPRPTRYPRMGGQRRFPIGTALIALLVVAASVGALFLFSGAKVEVTPTENAVAVTGTFDATASDGDLVFDIVTVEKVATNTVPSESTENVTQAAQGSIEVSNTQEAAQPLIKNTRFETPEGLIFRIKDSITVPAAKNGAPGTLTVTVYADEAGERYNIGPTTFTLPGLSGSDTFTKVTARSADSMKGGFAGPRPTVGQATKDAEYARLQSTLDAELKQEIAAKVQSGYVLVPGATAASYESQPDTPGVGNTVALSVKGVMRGVIFPEEALARAIAFQTVGTYTGQPLAFKSLEGLALAPAEGLVPVVGDTDFSFTLTGNTVLVWKVDTAKVAAAVAGKTRESAENVLQGFPEVERALLVLKPFWKNSFPSDPAKIEVSVQGEEETEDK
ncbi:MAG TPA: hypothetical protein VFY28_00450 [Candidatus Paceibacterota bacterium]|nr:hypothetical protein [Candidatus Paceibacterota bacterium]